MQKYQEKNKEKINCDCGSCIIKYKLTDHLKTKKHIEFVKNKSKLISVPEQMTT